MKRISLLFIFFSYSNFFSQESTVSELESKKNELLSQIKVLNDSIDKIESKINYIRSKEVQKLINDSTLTAHVKQGAKLKKSPSPFSDLLLRFNDETEVYIIDYVDDYFGVCSDSICGYLSDLWIVKNEKINDFVEIKTFEKNELIRLENERSLKHQKIAWAELEKKYVNEYGQENYERLKLGEYWVGMNKEMAIISLGKPKEVNRTVGSWGVHEQWVYGRIYLYFENGILKSFQD